MSAHHSLQFVPLCSSISSTFWDTFTKLKLNDLHLNTDPVPVYGSYSRRIVDGIPPIFELQHNAFKPMSRSVFGEVNTLGILINVNTIEEFKVRDKAELLKSAATQIWEAILSGEAESNPSILSSFLIFVFADLKKYHYYYWLAYPVFKYPDESQLLAEPQSLDVRLADPTVIDLLFAALQEYAGCLDYFVVQISGTNIHLFPLSSYLKLKQKENEIGCQVFLAYSDPSNDPQHPGWVLRNLLTLAAVSWPEIRRHTILSLREKVSQGITSISQSLVFDVQLSHSCDGVTEMPQCLGWEKNERGKMGPKFINLKGNMQPERIAESAVELNLQLMRWRLVPELNLEVIRKCRCLLLGAGTLGCNVARCLLGWGIQKITFLDCGMVSYSNPVRQSLYVFEDCMGEGKPKAEAAAQALKKIYPKVDAQGISVTVPMPGHPVGPSQKEQVVKDITELEKLVKEHDAIFLLTDSRESRWLLTVLGAAEQKIVLTAALGFDSFVVIRHGIPYPEAQDGNIATKVLGCYFCNDVVVPGNSVSDRTLDQQCTVTRPGMALMASGHIVEILISLLQHSLRGRAPAPSSKECDEPIEGVLGVVPHSIRYYFARLVYLTTATEAFKNCSACGPQVLRAYREHGYDFLLKVFNSTQYLEEVSGLAALHQGTQTVELWEVSDSDKEEETEDMK